jgi:hypothetical protein
MQQRRLRAANDDSLFGGIRSKLDGRSGFLAADFTRRAEGEAKLDEARRLRAYAASLIRDYEAEKLRERSQKPDPVTSAIGAFETLALGAGPAGSGISGKADEKKKKQEPFLLAWRGLEAGCDASKDFNRRQQTDSACAQGADLGLAAARLMLAQAEDMEQQARQMLRGCGMAVS